jgi:uncharacterized protein (TIGR03067 family)
MLGLFTFISGSRAMRLAIGAVLLAGVWTAGCGKQQPSPTSGPAAVPPPTPAGDTAALEGRWEVVSSEFEGQPATAAYRPGTVIVIEGGKFYFTDGSAKSGPTTVKLDAKAEPKSIDLGGNGGSRRRRRVSTRSTGIRSSCA